MRRSVIFMLLSVVLLLVGAWLEHQFAMTLSGTSRWFADTGAVVGLVAASCGVCAVSGRKVGAIRPTFCIFNLALCSAFTVALCRCGVPDVRTETNTAFWCSVGGVAADLIGGIAVLLSGACTAFCEAGSEP